MEKILLLYFSNLYIHRLTIFAILFLQQFLIRLFLLFRLLILINMQNGKIFYIIQRMDSDDPTLNGIGDTILIFPKLKLEFKSRN